MMNLLSPFLNINHLVSIESKVYLKDAGTEI